MPNPNALSTLVRALGEQYVGPFRTVQNNFTKGMVSSCLAHRFDLDQYKQACLRAVNVDISSTGGLKAANKPGTYDWRTAESDRNLLPGASFFGLDSAAFEPFVRSARPEDIVATTKRFHNATHDIIVTLSNDKGHVRIGATGALFQDIFKVDVVGITHIDSRPNPKWRGHGSDSQGWAIKAFMTLAGGEVEITRMFMNGAAAEGTVTVAPAIFKSDGTFKEIRVDPHQDPWAGRHG